MKKLLFVIIILIFINAYARNVEYNADGSITIISNGNRTVVNMDGKTPLGTTIQSVTMQVKNEKPVITLVYAAEYSDEDLTPTVRNIMTNTSNLLLREINKNNTKLTDLKLVFSLCRHCKIGYCKRTGKKEFTVKFFEKNKQYAEFSVPYLDTLKSDAETRLSALIVRRALGK